MRHATLDWIIGALGLYAIYLGYTRRKRRILLIAFAIVLWSAVIAVHVVFPGASDPLLLMEALLLIPLSQMFKEAMESMNKGQP